MLDISFESECHNIYAPHYTSESERGPSRLSSVESEFMGDCLRVNLESNGETESAPSVAEERDTISASNNAATPNLSWIINICSISKIEQHS